MLDSQDIRITFLQILFKDDCYKFGDLAFYVETISSPLFLRLVFEDAFNHPSTGNFSRFRRLAYLDPLDLHGFVLWLYLHWNETATNVKMMRKWTRATMIFVDYPRLRKHLFAVPSCSFGGTVLRRNTVTQPPTGAKVWAAPSRFPKGHGYMVDQCWSAHSQATNKETMQPTSDFVSKKSSKVSADIGYELNTLNIL